MAAAAGKHLLVEKPMAHNVAECDRMIQACRDAGVYLMAVQSQRFRGVHQRAKQLIEEGRIGNVLQCRIWTLFPAKDTTDFMDASPEAKRPDYKDPAGGLFLDQCCHNFDLMRWIVGKRSGQRVCAYDVLWRPPSTQLERNGAGQLCQRRHGPTMGQFRNAGSNLPE